MFLSDFGCIYQLPALSKVCSSRNFDGCVFSVFHCENCHFHVVLPRGNDINKIDVIPFAQLFPSLLSRIFSGSGQTSLSKDLSCLGYSFRIQVAKSFNLNTFDMCKSFNGAGTSHSQTDKSYSYNFHRLSAQSQNRFLSGDTLGCLKYDFAIYDVIRDCTFVFFNICTRNCRKGDK